MLFKWSCLSQALRLSAVLFGLTLDASLAAAQVASAGATDSGADLSKSFSHVTTVSKITNDRSLTSASGRQLQVITFNGTLPAAAAGRPAYRFLIEGGLHGNEQQASQFVLWLAERYRQGTSLLNKLNSDAVAFDFLPFANPDADVDGTRNNRHGVNLNRNFGVLWGVSKENPGSGGFSEPETQAIRSLFLARHYTAAVDVHGYINWVVMPSSPEAVKEFGYPVTKARSAEYQKWLNAAQQELVELPGYQLKTGALLGDGGAFEDWAFWSQGTLANCLEIASSERYLDIFHPELAHGHVLANMTARVDLFKNYELFVYKMFAQAVAIKKAAPAPANLAGK